MLSIRKIISFVLTLTITMFSFSGFVNAQDNLDISKDELQTKLESSTYVKDIDEVLI